MRKLIIMIFTHAVAIGFGFALGIYLLPILTAPESPDQAVLDQMADKALYTTRFDRDLRGSDFLHWGEGTVGVSAEQIAHTGSLAPGPDYKAYLVSKFVQHEDEFIPLKNNSLLIGDVKTFGGFLLDVPENVDIEQFTTILIWCEAFGEFITAAKYR